MNDNDHGKTIYVNGELWIGIIGQGDGTWIAYKVGDPQRVLCFVEEDK